MDYIYFFDGKTGHGEEAYDLIRFCASCYWEEIQDSPDVNIPIDDGDSLLYAEIEKTPQGKPYLKDYGIHFSISNTGSLWCALFSLRPCGIDMQEVKNIDGVKVAERFFGPRELAYAKENGNEGFFDIWVRREALVKMKGTGLLSEKFEVANEEGMLKDSFCYNEEKYLIKEIEIGQGIKCACVSTGEHQEIRFVGGGLL